MSSRRSQPVGRHRPTGPFADVRIVCALIVLALSSCNVEEAVPERRLTATQVLAGDDVAGYLRATTPRRFAFPDDHGPHPGYRNEWWYLTGNLETEDGRRFGYQVTFFASLLRPDDDQDCTSGNAWCGRHVWMGHAAVSDVANERHLAAEIFSRENPGLAGARVDPLRVWVQDWQLYAAGNGFPWELEVTTDEFALSLLLTSRKPPVLQGNGGLSRKSTEPGNASYYYSLTRIDTSGQLHIDGDTYRVSGASWMDREWSTSALAADQSGWDWFSLQFDDGTELMYYQLRDLAGNTHPYSSGNRTSLMGAQSTLAPGDVTLEALESWTAPDGTVYTTAWRMQAGDDDWIIRALFEDQLMDVTFRYWEGAVDVLDAVSGERLGQGYLEMVR